MEEVCGRWGSCAGDEVVLEGREEVPDDRDAPRLAQQALATTSPHVVHISVVLREAKQSGRERGREGGEGGREGGRGGREGERGGRGEGKEEGGRQRGRREVKWIVIITPTHPHTHSLSPLHLSAPEDIALLTALDEDREECSLGLLDGVHLGGDGAHLGHACSPEAVGVQAVLQDEAVGGVCHSLAVHAGNVPPEVAGTVGGAYLLGIYHDRVHLEHNQEKKK